MSRFSRLSAYAALMFFLFCLSTVASAQATRTWVSGVGDDANPCSRTAPCKTFAGAISKTATGGEISVLDPGGYGAVTITKSITINGEGTLAGILVSGSSGIIVNAASTSVVTIRNVSLQCVSSTLDGIRFLAGAALHVENVTIRGCTESGIDFNPNATGPSATSALYVRGLDVSNLVSTATGEAGIAVRPQTGAKATAVIDDTRIEGSKIGVRVEARAKVVIRDSTLNGNSNNGVAIISSTDPAVATIENSTLSFNGVGGSATAAIKLVGLPTRALLSNNVITGNDVGLLVSGGGEIISFGNNKNFGNNLLDGVPTATQAQQ